MSKTVNFEFNISTPATLMIQSSFLLVSGGVLGGEGFLSGLIALIVLLWSGFLLLVIHLALSFAKIHGIDTSHTRRAKPRLVRLAFLVIFLISIVILVS